MFFKKQILIFVFILLISLISVTAIVFDYLGTGLNTRFNPFTRQRDYFSPGNQSNFNWTFGNLVIIGNVNITTLLILDPPVECPAGTYMTYTNGTTAICVAAMRTTGENVSFDYSFRNVNVTQKAYADSFVGNIRGFYEENVTVTILNGNGTGSTSDCCDSKFVIQITAFPTTNTTSYLFNVSSDNIVETIQSEDSLNHTGNWLASFRSTGNSVLNYNITGATADEDFIIRVRWKR